MARSPYEKETEKRLHALGFVTDYKVRPPYAIKGYNVDYFGLFDHLAYDPKTKTLYMIQVKGVSGVPTTEYRNQIANFEVNKVVKEIWTYRANGILKRESFR
jgi:hypothetical protein